MQRNSPRRVKASGGERVLKLAAALTSLDRAITSPPTDSSGNLNKN
jgi:hypothetical protein